MVSVWVLLMGFQVRELSLSFERSTPKWYRTGASIVALAVPRHFSSMLVAFTRESIRMVMSFSSRVALSTSAVGGGGGAGWPTAMGAVGEPAIRK
jgi:hypothetical protein